MISRLLTNREKVEWGSIVSESEKPGNCVCGRAAVIDQTSSGPYYVSCGPNNGCGRFGPDAVTVAGAIAAWDNDIRALKSYETLVDALKERASAPCGDCYPDNQSDCENSPCGAVKRYAKKLLAIIEQASSTRS